jgi:hypothetical protein
MKSLMLKWGWDRKSFPEGGRICPPFYMPYGVLYPLWGRQNQRALYVPQIWEYFTLLNAKYVKQMCNDIVADSCYHDCIAIVANSRQKNRRISA